MAIRGPGLLISTSNARRTVCVRVSFGTVPRFTFLVLAAASVQALSKVADIVGVYCTATEVIHWVNT